MNDTCYCEQLEHPRSYQVFNLIVIIIILPPLAITGFVTNVINAVVLRRIQSHDSSNVYLCALGCSDALINLTSISIYIDSLKGFFPYFFRSGFVSFAMHLVPFSFMAQTCSIYLTLAAVLNGYVKDSSLKRYFPRAKRTVGGIVLFSVAYNFVRFFELRTEECFSQLLEKTITQICPTNVFIQNSLIYHGFMYTVLMNIFPYVCIVTFTALIVRRLYSDATGQAIASSFSGQIAVAVPSTASIMGAGRQAERPLPLVLVALVFIGCNIVSLISTILLTVMSQDEGEPMLTPEAMHMLGDVGNVLLIVNATANFFIYFAANAAFNQEFLKLCCNPKLLDRNQCDSQAQPLLNFHSIGNGTDQRTERTLSISATQPHRRYDTVNGGKYGGMFSVMNENIENATVARTKRSERCGKVSATPHQHLSSETKTLSLNSAPSRWLTHKKDLVMTPSCPPGPTVYSNK